MRYFIQLAYNGKHYCGWQRQPNAATVQQELEQVFSTFTQEAIEITGCGRTDTGVHASFYIAHFDCQYEFKDEHLRNLNAMLPRDISLYKLWAVDEAQNHARFSAYNRSYVYFISFVKDPFRSDTSWQYSQAAELSLVKLNEAAQLIMSYQEFAPLCKRGSDVEHYRCTITNAEWRDWDGRGLQFHVSANRFLRGMVRLMVGACMEVAKGKLTIEDLKASLDKQTDLPRPLSVPAHGLFLSGVAYPVASASGAPIG
jgi:tRNA pseudouridine38-40 synthase